MAQQRQRFGPTGRSLRGGHSFDDGVNGFDRVNNVIMETHGKRIKSITVECEKNRVKSLVTHGTEPRTTFEFGPFETNHGHITKVGGIYIPPTVYNPTGYVKSLYFINSRGNKSQVLGTATRDVHEQPFEFPANDDQLPAKRQLVGLHGTIEEDGDGLVAIGATFAKMP